MLTPVPLCRNLEFLRPFVESNQPATMSVAGLIANRFDSDLRWTRTDNLIDPHAVLCRSRRFILFADSGPAAARVLAEAPRHLRMSFGATPTRFCRLVRKCWRGPDAGRRLWYNHCYLYLLKPGRLVDARAHRVTRLEPADAASVARLWPYGRSAARILTRIRSGPSLCIRRRGLPVAWALTHEDGSMGFLHVLAPYRGQGMARTLTTALAQSLLRLGVPPFMYIVTRNQASIRLSASLGFARGGRFSWFGTE